MHDLDYAVQRALHSLLGRYWKERLQRAVRDAYKPEKKRRNYTPEQRERRRQQMREINARKSPDMTDPCLTPDDLADALDMLKQGKSAAEIHDWLGGGLGWWVQWCDERKHYYD